MNKSRIKAVLLLPVNAVIVIPALILLFSQQQVGLAFNLLSFVGLAVWCGGLGVVWRTVALFGRQKKGFIAPWNPPAELIIAWAVPVCAQSDDQRCRFYAAGRSNAVYQ